MHDLRGTLGCTCRYCQRARERYVGHMSDPALKLWQEALTREVAAREERTGMRLVAMAEGVFWQSPPPLMNGGAPGPIGGVLRLAEGPSSEAPVQQQRNDRKAATQAYKAQDDQVLYDGLLLRMDYYGVRENLLEMLTRRLPVAEAWISVAQALLAQILPPMQAAVRTSEALLALSRSYGDERERRRTAFIAMINEGRVFDLKEEIERLTAVDREHGLDVFSAYAEYRGESLLGRTLPAFAKLPSPPRPLTEAERKTIQEAVGSFRSLATPRPALPPPADPPSADPPTLDEAEQRHQALLAAITGKVEAAIANGRRVNTVEIGKREARAWRGAGWLKVGEVVLGLRFVDVPEALSCYYEEP